MPTPHIIWTLPFAGLLLAIALLPLLPHAAHWWEKNTNKLLVGLALGSLVLAHYALREFGHHHREAGLPTLLAVLEHAILRDYVPFMMLLFSLYTISGGIRVRGDLVARPAVNTAILAIGALAASFIGTTGASMVLIRPLLQSNRERKYVRHTVVFFIFLVSNVGGVLLPIGDPPLFLGYLEGVPFLWTLRLFMPWAFCVSALLAVYYAWDRVAYAREDANDLADDARKTSPLRIHGGINLLWLIGVVAAVALIKPGQALPGTPLGCPRIRSRGGDAGDDGPLAGHDPARAPKGGGVLLWLHHRGRLPLPGHLPDDAGPPGDPPGARGEPRPVDPLPVFLGERRPVQLPRQRPDLLRLPGDRQGHARGHRRRGRAPQPRRRPRRTCSAAISLGSVFMGANTYIGNGPNFMVKSIAEKHGVRMPSFFGYMLYSACILIPLFGLVTLIFLR